LVRDFEARGISCLITEEQDAEQAAKSYLEGRLIATNESSCGCGH
jgi:predicted Fe-Mo cluster-binding NifX family protein